ncbi:hypothetical protein FT663_03230 [Candidozyma haemuli var. vulneris]|uniref:Uncharacterized protein n=1 Tax=Candidozyma haemuli TaxID=45357 RepID=A0A2V1AYV2_9ASCO|nr:hypothetical protein CXQ85_004689 [[Candida] haemuloni]KAF3988705.1 hypothetical protein FT662_03233 [[Candida] haemuloni var. vulneris]KAF3990377.1 hypothetical protein FT663_03230 [[Candida] haemuloni var. vulneris]PVH22021.1 hypothetical protein CXQ85_004689 [[Candida] haemuloni]
MATYKYLLNMENHGPINRLVKELSTKIQENEAILANISRSIDTKITLPQLPGENNKEKHQEQADSNKSDSLRALIDEKYLSKMDHVEQFEEVQNTRLRQLLIDNKALAELHKARCEQNKQFYRSYQGYEKLIQIVILPQLTKLVCDYNIEKITDLRQKRLQEKLALDEALWEKYVQYVANLDKIYHIVSETVEALQSVLDEPQVQRLEQQLLIVERLALVAKNGHTQLKRPQILSG